MVVQLAGTEEHLCDARGALASDAPVLVVGAGPSGLAVALELARAGVEVRVIDRRPEPSGESRAVGVQTRTLELLDLHGLGDAALARGKPIEAMNVYARGLRTARIDHGAVPSRFACALALAQSETEALMRELLAALGTWVEWGVELRDLALTATGATVELAASDGSAGIVEVPWLIACDGAHSTVRRSLGMAFEGESSDEGWAVMDARLDWTLPAGEGHIFAEPESYTIVLPQVDGVHRVMLSGRAREQLGSVPTVGELEGYLRERCRLPATLSDVRWTSPFGVQRRQVTSYREQRVLLVGDAAHVHSPSGGQGLNTGIQDAFNLGWKLALVVRGAAGDELLDSYERERKPVAGAVLRLTDDFQRRTLALAKDTHAELKLSGVALGYPDSPLSVDRGNGPAAVTAGGRVVDVGVEEAAGGASRVYELLRRRALVVAMFPAAGCAGRVQLEAAERWARAPLATGLELWVIDGAAQGWRTVADREGELTAAFGMEAGGFAVLRPDAYVGLRTHATELDAVEDYLERVLRLRALSPSWS